MLSGVYQQMSWLNMVDFCVGFLDVAVKFWNIQMYHNRNRIYAIFLLGHGVDVTVDSKRMHNLPSGMTQVNGAVEWKYKYIPSVKEKQEKRLA